MRRVVITGLGAVTPCGLTAVETWDSMREGRSGLTRVTRFDVKGMPSQAAGEVKGFDTAALLGRRAIRRAGLFMQYAMVAADEAVRDAFPDGITVDRDRLGVFVGSGVGGFPEICDEAEKLSREGMERVSPLFIPRSLANLANGRLAIRFQARGPSLCICTACAAGNHSIGEAWMQIATGGADAIIAGGAEASLTPLGYAGFMAMRAMSRNTDDPARASRPFDRDRDGFVMSEGSGIAVLESLESAQQRGAHIRAEVIGYAATTDAYHVTAPPPGGAGAARCMKAALERAGIAPEQVDYINAHGTGTPANDPAETAAIRTVFGAHADKLAVSSTKAVTGHLLAAAGGVECVAAVRALETGIVPPTAHLEHPDPACDLDYVAEGARRCDPVVALSNGFGFGGANATLVFRKWEG